MSDVSFPSMGSQARIVLEGSGTERVRAFLLAYERALTRFDAGSELCRLNCATESAVPVSRLVRHAVAAALWAAERSHGLVDPTLLAPLRSVGYTASRRAPELPLHAALAAAPPRAPAAPDPASRWRLVEVDEHLGVIRRPPGLELDTGGTGKGLAADLAVRLVPETRRIAIDCGGDIRVAGDAARRHPFDAQVRHPLSGEIAYELRIDAGGIATSGLDVRLWRDPAGRPVHHLLDPSTGRPAWTGLVGATALAPTALEAEVLAKAALLSGPAGAGRILARHGGLVVRDDGEVVPIGRLRARPTVQLSTAASAAA